MPRKKRNKLAPFREEVRQMLAQGWLHQAIIDALRTKYGVAVSRWTLQRFWQTESNHEAPQQLSSTNQPPIAVAGDDWKARIKNDATKAKTTAHTESELQARIRNAKLEDIHIPYPEQQQTRPPS